MPRATHSPASRARHKKWIKRAKGYRGRRHKVFKLAKEAVLKAGQYAYRDRRRKKTVFRAQWQIKINAAARLHGLTYSRLINELRTHNIRLNRKIMSQLAEEQPLLFKQLVEKVTEK